MAREDIDPTPEPEPRQAVDEDEDLFDFPPVGTASSPSIAQPEATTEEVDLLREQGDVFDDDLAVFEDDPIALAESILASVAGEPEPEDPPAARSGGPKEPDFRGEIDLDEDIFDFPIPEGARRRTPVEPASEPDLDELPDDLRFVLDDDPDPFDLSEPEPEPQPELDLELEPAPVLATEPEVDVIRTTTAEPQVAPARGDSSRALWALVGTSLLVNATFLAFAWRTSSSLDANVEAFRRHLVTAVDALRLQTLEAAPPAETPTRRPEPEDEHPAPSPAPVDPLATDGELQLGFAREEIAAEDFRTARRRLFRMLSIADATSDPTARASQTDAAFLIGDAYLAEARALARRGGAR